jgi:hypothetical protein
MMIGKFLACQQAIACLPPLRVFCHPPQRALIPLFTVMFRIRQMEHINASNFE